MWCSQRLCPVSVNSSQRLEYFHTVTGFPPDVLHDHFEGIVPVELALCIGEMICCKYFMLSRFKLGLSVGSLDH